MTDSNGSAVLIPAFPVERRINPFKPELRAADGARPAHIVGYASIYNKLSRKLSGGFVERVNPGTFQRSQESGWDSVVCRFNHNDDFLLGTIAGQTLRLALDTEGLYYDDEPPTFRQDIIELMHRGDVSGSSFAFRNVEGGDDWRLSDFGMPLRTLLSLDLIDVAPCTTPAYPDATAAARSVDGAVMSLAHKFGEDPAEVRSLFDSNQAVKLFKRTDVMLKPSPLPEVRTDTPEEEPVDLSEQRAALYEVEVRAKYNADQMQVMMKAGKAMKNAKGEPSYPIGDEEDLHNAIHAVGRGGTDHDAIKAHIKKNAKALGKTEMLPDDWTGNGPEKKSVEELEAELRAMTEERDAAVAAAKSAKDKTAAPTKAKATAGADEDEDPDGSDSAGNGTEAEGRSDDAPAEEERAALASYDDLETCAECGAKNQHGKHCTSCGKPMALDAPGNGKFCANCGGKMDAKRSDHQCDVEERSDEDSAEETPADPAEELRNRRMELLSKRYDPYDGQDED